MTPSRIDQPWLGLAGLLFVVPIAALLAFAGGPETAVLVLGPLVAMSLTLVAMVAFWWNDWPGTRLRPAWSGWVDTVVIVVLAFAVALPIQSVVGRADPRGLVDPTPGPGHTPGFPVLLPLGAAAFSAMLQLTQVAEKWPLQRLPPIQGGLAAAALSYVIAILLYLLLVEVHPPVGSAIRPQEGLLTGVEFGALLTMISVWQVWLYLAWHGWPFTLIRSTGLRRLLAVVTIDGGGVLTYAALRGLVEPDRLTVLGGAATAAGIVVSVLFGGTMRPGLSARADRFVAVPVIAIVTALLSTTVATYADRRTWTSIASEEWQALAMGAVSISVFLHVAIGQRWPFR